jgi:putative colanic acid biosynthesis UDP-glucose lipid carrier transferase
MNIAATPRNSNFLPATASELTDLELARNDALLGASQAQLAAPSWNGANFFEMGRSESPYFDRRWRWPLSYRSIELVAIFVDALVIVSAGVLVDAAYRLATAAPTAEITVYGGAAAVVAALLTCLMKERGLYKPSALLNWTAQVRAVTTAWIAVFMFLAGCVFALKIGVTFYRVTFISFDAFGVCSLIVV